MLELLQFHGRHAEKLNGRTVLKFRVNAPGDGFEIVFEDGSVESVSFRKLIKNAWQTRGKTSAGKVRVIAKNNNQALVEDTIGLQESRALRSPRSDTRISPALRV